MKGMDLLNALGRVQDSFVTSAGDFRENQGQPRRLALHRAWLIAAIIALLLMLVGCAAVFFWLQDRSIRKEPYTQILDSEGHYITPTEKVMDTVTMFGSSGSNLQKAMAERWNFRLDYPAAFDLNVTEADYEKIPENYRYTYDCYTLDMVEKLEEIAEKYDLQLLGTEIPFQRYQYDTVLQALGVTSLLRSDAQGEMENGQGYISLPKNFYFEFLVSLDGLEKAWAEDISVNYSFSQLGYFPGFGTRTLDLEQFRQWKYTTADGTEVFLALNQQGAGIILAELESGSIYMDVDSNLGGPNFPEPETVMDENGLERLADLFDYSIQPQSVDAAALESTLDAEREAQEQKMRDSVKTYAGFTEYLLEEGPRFTKQEYAFCDLNGDGTEDMILWADGNTHTWFLTMEQGKAHEHLWSGEIRILENGGFGIINRNEETEEDYFYYYFYPPMDNGYPFRFDYSGNGPEWTYEDAICGVSFRYGTWKKHTSIQDTGTVIQESEAETIIAQHPEKKLDWQPVWDYLVDENGRTLGDELSSRTLPQSDAEYLAFYADAAEQGDIWFLNHYTHFALYDLNQDGIQDILMSSDGHSIEYAFTWKYGKAVTQASPVGYLCEGNAMRYEEIRSAADGADLLYCQIQKFEGNTLVTLADMVQNKASGEWTDQLTGLPMTAEEAEAVIASYPRVELSFRPIDELYQ